MAGELDELRASAEDRWELTQRLDGVRRSLEAALLAELDAAVDAFVAAAERLVGLGEDQR